MAEIASERNERLGFAPIEPDVKTELGFEPLTETPQKSIYLHDRGETISVPVDFTDKEAEETIQQNAYGNFAFRQAPEAGFYEKRIRPILETTGILKKPSELRAEAMNYYAEAKELSEKTGIPTTQLMSYVEENWDDIVENKYGLLTPRRANKRMFRLMIGAGLVHGAITVPFLAILKNVGIFLGLQKSAEATIYPGIQYVKDKIANKPWSWKMTRVEELLPEEASEATEGLLMFGELAALGIATSKVPGASKSLFEKITKKTIIKYNMPRSVYLKPEKVRDIFQTGKKIGPEELALWKELGLTGEAAKLAIKQGVTIKIPSERIIRVADRPFWGKIKGLFNIKPTAKVVDITRPEVLLEPKKLPVPLKVIEPKPIIKPEIVPKISEKIITKAEVLEPLAEEVPITPKQIKIAATIANKKLLISKKGKFKPQFRFLAEQMTGKRSLRKMTEDEADFFINSLKSLVVRPGRVPRIPRAKELITEEFAGKISGLQEIGLKEKIRPAHRVFEKIGLKKEIFEPAFETEIRLFEELNAFRQEALEQQKTVGITKESSQRIFRSIEQTLTKEDLARITPAERKVADWGKRFFNEWADRLELPTEKRVKNYITHIFEKEVTENLKTKHPLDPDLIRAMDFITPKTIFNPFLQERLGKTIGLKEDFWSAIEAYESRQLKVFHYEPLIKRIRVYEKFLPPNAARFLRSYIARITNRPLVLDKEIKQDFEELAEVISKLPQGEKLGKLLSQGNAPGLLAYNFTGLLYEMFLGLRPASAIKNLGQNSLTISEVGAKNFVEGRIFKTTKEGKEILKQSLVMRSRKLGFLPGLDESFIKGLESKRRKVAFFMFRLADQENVGNAFMGGYTEAKNLNLPEEWAIKRGDEVAAKTQFIYSKLAGAMWAQSALGRILSVLTTWPLNWLELMIDFGTGKPSTVYTEYERTTGEKVNPEGWLKRRKQMIRYMAIVTLALMIERKTRLKASYYTGFTSIKSLANMAKGQFAGLDIPGTAGQLIAGIATGDEKMTKKAWSRLRPDRLIIIIRELEDIMLGKKDWLDLFFLLEKDKKKKDKTAKL